MQKNNYPQNSLTSGKAVDAIFLGLSKAVDKVLHNMSVSQLENVGMSGPFLSWF